MTSLFAAVAEGRNADRAAEIAIVPLALAYKARNGIRLGREERTGIGWYGDMEMTRHAWSVLKGGPIEVEVRIGAAVEGDQVRHRKTLAAAAERHVRRLLVSALRGRPIDDQHLAAAAPSPTARMRPRRPASSGTPFT
jgi:1-acyl-sn-glycerol-3-phosphate acyltransferase